jgi:ribosomal protein L35
MSSEKTNKSFTKRLRISKNGKVMARKAGQNHFNAKESRRSQISNKHGLGSASEYISKVAKRYFVPHK